MATLHQENHHNPPPAVIFRTTKARKNLRQRAQDQQHSFQEQSQPQPQTSPSSSQDDAEQPSSVTAALRARIPRKPRLRGVAFSTDSQADDHAVRFSGDGDSQENRLLLAKSIPDRFMHQTGLVSSKLNDKHMTDYIESRLSSRAAAAAAPPSSFSSHNHQDDTTHPSSSSDTRPGAVQPTRHGKIVEVDLSKQPLPQEDPTRKRKADAPLVPGPRWRNRRGSDDTKRDELVDAFLHENKLDVYDVPTRRPPNTTTNTSNPHPRDGRSADDRMAEEFRRRFFDEMALRRQRRKPIPPTRQQRELREMRATEVLKGPKLGGSRNNRAAVRNILLQQEKEKAGRKP